MHATCDIAYRMTYDAWHLRGSFSIQVDRQKRETDDFRLLLV